QHRITGGERRAVRAREQGLLPDPESKELLPLPAPDVLKEDSQLAVLSLLGVEALLAVDQRRAGGGQAGNIELIGGPGGVTRRGGVGAGGGHQRGGENQSGHM